MPERVSIVGYADDLATVAMADSERILKITVKITVTLTVYRKGLR